MTRYINKADVAAEIKRLIDKGKYSEEYDCAFRDGNNAVCNQILHFLDTLEAKEVDEIIKNAEDHAYFAGSENTREKLIDKACKWWEVELTYPSMTPEEFKWYKNKVRKFRKDMEDDEL